MLNEEPEVMIFQNYFLSIYPKFLHEFSKWMQNENSHANLVIDLIQLHKINKKMKENITDCKDTYDFMDFNLMVDDILEISPHYNSNTPRTKKIKPNPELKKEKSLVITRNNSKNIGDFMQNNSIKQKSLVMTRSNSKNTGDFMQNNSIKFDEAKLFNIDNSKVLIPEFLPSFSYKDFLNFNQKSTILSPRPIIFDSFKSFKSFYKNDENMNNCENRFEGNDDPIEENINKSSKKMKIFGQSMSQSELDFGRRKNKTYFNYNFFKNLPSYQCLK